MSAILALDAGTTSSRALVFDEGGAILAVAQREFRQLYPRPGWVEHDAEEIWRTQIDVAAEAISNAKVEIAAIGITNQRETTVLWDRQSGRPVANAIVWQDRRTAEMCDALRAHEQLVQSRTGLVIDAYFSGTKLRWLLDRTDADPSRLAFGTIDSWLVWNLTRGAAHVTDVTNASRTMLFDIHRGAWDDELLAIAGVPRSVLPEVGSSSEVYARTASGLPIPAGIPIAGMAGDQQAALFGQRCTRAGMAKNTYGTGSFVVMNTGDRVVTSPHGLLATIAWRLGDGPLQYALEGSIFVTGAAVQWLRDELRIIKTAPEVEPLAASVPDSGGVMMVPAFTGLGTPHWDPYARGAILGLTRGSTAAHIARATLDSIALQTADVLQAMREDSGMELTELRVDGGASTNDLLMQTQADLAGIPVVRTRNPETTALGAAYLAGLQPPEAQTRPERVFEPRIGAAEREEKLALWRRAVERAKQWAIVALLLFVATHASATTPPLPYITDQNQILTPDIAFITPNRAPLHGGTIVTIGCEAFQPPVAVQFIAPNGGTADARVFSVSFDRIRVEAPRAADLGAGPDELIDVRVRNIGSETADVLRGGFRYTVSPVITSIGPDGGPAEGGTYVWISGAGLHGPLDVIIAGVRATSLVALGNGMGVRTGRADIRDCRDRTGPVQVVDVVTGETATGPDFTYDLEPLRIVKFSPRVVTAGHAVDITVERPFGGVTVTFGTLPTRGFFAGSDIRAVTSQHLDFPTAACTYQGIAGIRRVAMTVDLRVSDDAGCSDVVPAALTIRPPEPQPCAIPPAVTVVNPPEGQCLRFGRVTEVKTLSIELANRDLPGTQQLLLTRAFITGPDAADFTIDSSPASPRLSVTYRGTTRGYRRATAVIWTNDPERPVVEVCLRALRR